MPRLFRALSALALAGLLSHCATASGAGGQGASGGAVGVRFAWPEGFSAQVVSTTTETRQGEPARTQRMNYQLRLEGTGEERKLVTDRMELQEDAPAEDAGGQPPLTPTLVLGPGGELRRIEAIDPVVTQMAQEAESQGIPEAQRSRILALVRDALEQSSRSRWEMLVGKWNGLTLKPGETVERPGQTTLPMFGSRVDTRERVTLKERVPCAEGEAEPRCVKLVLESSADPEKKARASAELVKQVKVFMTANVGMPESAMPELTVMTLRLDSSVEFIAEPETLIPHRQRAIGTVQVVLQDPEGEQQNFDSQSERVEVFTPVSR